MGKVETAPSGRESVWANLQLRQKEPLRSIRPQEWPAELKGALAWEPSSFASVEDYALVLSQDEVSEVHSALEHFNGGFFFIAELHPPLRSRFPQVFSFALR